MSILNSALNQIWSSALYSFSLALSLYFSYVTCSMHLNINLCYVLYYVKYSHVFCSFSSVAQNNHTLHLFYLKKIVGMS